jgi:tRNA dimethylallyltransferase
MKVYFIVGPTASGKSQFALQIAEEVGGVIVNADSLQFYNGLSIGSAAPSQLDFARVPHYLFHCLDYPDEASAGWFYRMVTSELERLAKSGIQDVFIVGGSGFYFQILENGLLPVGGEDPKIRSELEWQIAQGKGAELYLRLQELDPEWALKIKPQDHYRVVRALESIQVSGKKLSEIYSHWRRTHPVFPYPLKKIGITGSKQWLLERVTLRTQLMFKSGLLDEIRPFQEKNMLNWAPFRGVGYKEVVQYLQGKIKSHQELEEAIIKSTMLLIKKQKTWFKRDRAIYWIHPENAQSQDWALDNFYRIANLEEN